MVSELLMRMRSRPSWRASIDELVELADRRSDKSVVSLSEYAAVYRGRRAAMVVDVVASRQRNYTNRVLPVVEKFQRSESAVSLVKLAELGLQDTSGFMAAEVETIRSAASALSRYCIDYGLDEEAGVSQWAVEQEAIRTVPKLDPHLGCVSGIGIGLFAYMRMRSGADAIKPDVRVRKRMTQLGFKVPAGEAALLFVAEAAAEELGITRFSLDRLLW